MSGRKNVIVPIKIASAQSLGATFQSAATNIQFLDRVALALDCTTSDAVGTFTIQGRTSPPTQQGSSLGPASEWADLDMNAMTLSSADKYIVIDIINTGLVWIRVSYVRTSGTGSCDIWLAAKEA